MNSGDDSNKTNIILQDEVKLVLDHDYDGIQELDHPLPNWWIGLFYSTIIFSVFYAGYYLTGIGPNLREELDASLKGIEAAKLEAKAKAPQSSGNGNDVFMAALKNPDALKKGGEVFSTKCAPCHGDKGQGIIGPNLTDNFWLHGDGTPVEISRIVREGVPEKGMPPWGPILTDDEVTNVVAFIRSMHGTMPAGAKEAQGTEQPWKEL